ncbi:MAG: DNA cytosine methyltransferase, partial [Gammaproteobacteria bacterium]|nr:DNA cytosine methyltransferase [Gammaproteobacteria bacterium]
GDIPKNQIKLFTRGHGPHPGWLASEPMDKRPPPVRVVFIKNIVEVNGWDMLNAAGVDKVDVVIGSPPCQSFSSMNTHKKKGDFRDFLMFEYARLVLEINPDSFVLENVPPTVKAKLLDGRKLIDVFQQILSQRDWDLYYEIQGMYPDIDKNLQNTQTAQCNIVDF